MNILWLGKRFYTNKDTLSEHFGRMYQLPQQWQQAGQQVRLWLVDYHTRESIRGNDGGMVVATTPLFSLEFMRQVFYTLITKRAHYIIASGDCYLGLLGWILARLSGAIFVFDVYDKYDVFSGYRRLGSFDLFVFLLKRADRLMFASKKLAETLSKKLHAPHFVVPNGVDSALFGPRSMQACRQELGLREDILFVGYFGGMEWEHGVADLIDAVACLRAKGQAVELLLAGRAVPELPLDAPGIRYLGMVPHTKIPLLMNACDVLVVPYRHGPFIDMAASCKIAEYLACRRPLVSTDTPNLSANFPTQAGMMGPALCRVSDPNDMARALAYQLKTHMVLPMPERITWDAIADDTLRWLQTNHPKIGGAQRHQ